jgi:hypothetical protein
MSAGSLVAAPLPGRIPVTIGEFGSVFRAQPGWYAGPADRRTNLAGVP